jgi:hypothetical protein
MSVQALKNAPSICLNENAPDSILTFSGVYVRPLDPDPETIHIEDIAHALANQCRFTGHVKQFYSVAQHSYYVSRMAPTYELEGLLHDASEAYLSDLSRPLKYANGLGDVYREAERKLEYAIAKRFNLEYPWPLKVKMADDVMLVREARDLMPSNVPLNMDTDAVLSGAAPKEVVGWLPEFAKTMFLHRYQELTR